MPPAAEIPLSQNQLVHSQLVTFEDVVPPALPTFNDSFTFDLDFFGIAPDFKINSFDPFDRPEDSEILPNGLQPEDARKDPFDFFT